MSESTPRDLEQRVWRMSAEILGLDYEDHEDDEQIQPVYDAFMQLINAEVLAVLDELEKESISIGDVPLPDGPDPMVVLLSTITQLKQRYGGKEQGDV